MKVLYLTTFKPDSENNGQPSILSKLIYEGLVNEYGDSVKLHVAKIPKNFILRKFYQLMLPFFSEVFSQAEEYDIIYLYPYWCVNNIPEKCLNRSRVVAPDLQSTLFSRMAKVKLSFLNKIKSNLVARYIKYQERKLAKVKSIYFVGQTDVIDFCLNNKAINASYIPHPMIIPIESSLEREGGQRKLVLISGAGGEKYYGDLLERYLLALMELDTEINILVSGKGNKEVLKDSIKSFKNFECVNFVESYDEIFMNNKVVHVSPLIVGCGTKNRILDALARKSVCVTTEIGAENLHEFFDTNSLKVSSDPHQMAKLTLSSFDDDIDWDNVDTILLNRNSRFERLLIK